MSNNSNISPNWASFNRLWKTVAIILFLLLLLLLFLGYGPAGKNCEVTPTTIEKIVEKETIIDNPELLTKIGDLEKENQQIAILKEENSQIASLKATIEELQASAGLVEGLQAKVKTLEGVDLNFENPKLTSRINLLESENASIADLKKRIVELEGIHTSLEKATTDATNEKVATLTQRISELEGQNKQIAPLQTKIKELEAETAKEPEVDPKLLQEISELETENKKIPGLEARIKILESQQTEVTTKEAENPALLKRIEKLEAENGLIPGLKAKIKSLEAIDINFVKAGSSKNKSATSENSSSVGDTSASQNKDIAVPDVGKLYFKIGSSWNPQDENNSLSKIIEYLKNNTDAKVILTGFHDATGNASWNRRLAIKRSNRVARQLRKAGISRTRINIDVPSKTLGTGLAKEARRVEVKIIKSNQ